MASSGNARLAAWRYVFGTDELDGDADGVAVDAGCIEVVCELLRCAAGSQIERYLCAELA